MGESKKSKAYRLFSDGKTTASTEIKALHLKQATRYNYFSQWNRDGKPDHIPLSERVASKATQLGGGEKILKYVEPEAPVEAEIPIIDDIPPEEIPEIAEDEEASEEFETPGEDEERAKTTIKLVHTKSRTGKPNYSDGDKEDVAAIPEEIIGSGFRIETTVSLKTLAFFEIAKTIDLKLTLGNFIDDCVVDFFTGRGKDFGLLDIEEAKEV